MITQNQFEVWWKGEIASDFVQQALDELEKISCVRLSGGFGAEATAVSAARRKLDSALSTLREANTRANTPSTTTPTTAAVDAAKEIAQIWDYDPICKQCALVFCDDHWLPIAAAIISRNLPAQQPEVEHVAKQAGEFAEKCYVEQSRQQAEIERLKGEVERLKANRMDVNDVLCTALETAINTVECASIGPDGKELPWYKQAHAALALAGRPWMGIWRAK